MFIRLTRTDGLPIWINASFVVTVEPTRSGGSVVVPIGDGLDYDVREAPESVLALLDEAPPARVVPVPPPKALTKTPDDVSPEAWASLEDSPGAKPEKSAEAAEPTSDQPTKKRGRGRRSKTTAKKTSDEKKNEPAAAAESAAESTSAAEGAQSHRDLAAGKPEPADFDKIVAGLKAHKCRTERRLRNAIKGFFGKTDEGEIDHIVETMINKNYILIGADGHIDWTA